MLSRKAETIEIPYEGTTLPGYFFSISQRGYDNNSNNNNDDPINTNHKQVAKGKPTLILTTGLDGAQEELYFLGIAAALERGYNCLTFE